MLLGTHGRSAEVSVGLPFGDADTGALLYITGDLFHQSYVRNFNFVGHELEPGYICNEAIGIMQWANTVIPAICCLVERPQVTPIRLHFLTHNTRE